MILSEYEERATETIRHAANAIYRARLEPCATTFPYFIALRTSWMVV